MVERLQIFRIHQFDIINSAQRATLSICFTHVVDQPRR